MDRGNKMWEGHRIILPEHRDLLFDHKQKEREYHQPDLAEDQIEKVGRVIERSVMEKRTIVLTYANKYGSKRFVGTIVRVNPFEHWLIIQNEEDKKLIPMSKIIDAEEVTK